MSTPLTRRAVFLRPTGDDKTWQPKPNAVRSRHDHSAEDLRRLCLPIIIIGITIITIIIPIHNPAAVARRNR